jgi:cold shock CspA family protein
MPRMQGVVIWFSNGKEYGFIRPDNRMGDVFIHKSNIDEEPQTLSRGERVEFDCLPSTRKLGKTQAENLVSLDRVKVASHNLSAAGTPSILGGDELDYSGRRLGG